MFLYDKVHPEYTITSPLIEYEDSVIKVDSQHIKKLYSAEQITLVLYCRYDGNCHAGGSRR